ncbi:ABC transporter permease [Alloiococcus sp. CFN-8]|uniref:ABC transporter permease n=1 Tax=Alloiococcus sp. CFN-8 TaxID=3416081 RepID=UPI003CF2D9E1
MLNLLRADFYKLRRSKSYWISLGALVAIVAYIGIDIGSLGDKKEELSPSTIHWIYMMFKEKAFLPYFMPVFQGIFITMLITKEYNTGTIKDSVSLGFSRWKIYFSKLITVSLGSILMMLSSAFVTAVTAIFVFGLYGTFSLQDLLLLLRMLLIHGLLYSAYGSIFLMTAFLIKNIGGALVFNIFFSLIIGSFASLLGNGYIGRILLISNFSPTAVPYPLGIDLKLAIAAALSYLIIFTGIGGVTFKILDIK